MQVVEHEQEARGSERREGSIIQSLSELQDIERQRIADELAAIQSAEAARVAAREAAERRAREEEAARARAEREARLAAEHARVEAEREDRRRIDAAAAAELARQQVALEHARMEREHELRRAAVARTRPTWMMAVMGLALAAAGLMMWLALSSRSLAEEASHNARIALLDRDLARTDARAARSDLESFQRGLEENSRAIQAALTELQRAKTQAQLEAVEARLRIEHQRALDLDHVRRRGIIQTEHAIRIKPIVIPEECLKNSFAPGCPVP
jgi:hypothetical protein